jgi:hypothetical protein
MILRRLGSRPFFAGFDKGPVPGGLQSIARLSTCSEHCDARAIVRNLPSARVKPLVTSV